tara:strand:+ start:2795 stop:3673 length:879 start_codon:yes stop_codon:yes gene_type:complete
MLSKVIYIIFFLIVIYALYVLNLKSTLEDNEKVIQKIHNNDFLISLSILPIFTENNNSYFEYYKIINYLDRISKPGSIYKRNKMSIKIQQLSLSKKEQWKRLLDIVDYAQRKNIFIWLSAIIQETLDTEYHFYLKLLSKGYKNIGITLAAYNESVSSKIDYILTMRGHVRLVKGIYEGDVYDSKQIDEIYITNAKKLIDSGYYHTIASHDFKILNSLHDYHCKFNDYIEVAYFYNSYDFVNHNLQKSPIKTRFMSFYVFHGEYYPFIRDNIGLYSTQNILYIIEAKLKGLYY